MTEESIKEILLRIEKKQDDLFSEVIAILRGGDPDPKKWMDMLQVQKFLEVSRRTVYRIRDDNRAENPDENKVRWIQVRSKTLFYTPDIYDLKRKYLK